MRSRWVFFSFSLSLQIADELSLHSLASNQVFKEANQCKRVVTGSTAQRQFRWEMRSPTERWEGDRSCAPRVLPECSAPGKAEWWHATNRDPRESIWHVLSSNAAFFLLSSTAGTPLFPYSQFAPRDASSARGGRGEKKKRQLIWRAGNLLRKAGTAAQSECSCDETKKERSQKLPSLRPVKVVRHCFVSLII